MNRSNFILDLRFAGRRLRRSPLLSSAVALTFALGIGANGAVFSFLDAMLFEPPTGVVKPDGVVRLYPEEDSLGSNGVPTEFSYAQFAAMREATRGSAQLAAIASSGTAEFGDSANLGSGRVDYVTSDFLPILVGRPAIGRFFSAAEDAVMAPAHVAVLSYESWQRYFNAAPQVLGQALMVDAEKVTIVGVAPKHFDGLDVARTAVWLPASLAPHPMSTAARPWYTARNANIRVVIARPSTGSSAAQLAARATVGYRRIASSRVEARTTIRPGSLLSQDGPWAQSDVNSIAIRIAAVVVVILLMSCANIVCLLIGRAGDRRREMGIRKALGATGLRLAVQLTTESALLAGLGGATALLVTCLGSTMLHSVLFPATDWRGSVLGWRTFLFVCALASIGGTAVGLTSSLSAGVRAGSTLLRSGHHELNRTGARLRATLLASQSGLALMLVAAAGLFVRSSLNIREIDMGFRPAGLIVASLHSSGGQRIASRTGRSPLDDVADELRGRPGIQSVATATAAPFYASGREAEVAVTGADSAVSAGLHSDFVAVSPSYLAVLGASIKRGRGILADDDANTRHVAVVNEAMARAYWPGQDPLGKCISFISHRGQCYAVVGVVGDIYQFSVTDPPHPEYFIPKSQAQAAATILLVRTAPGSNERLISELRSRLSAVAPPTLSQVTSMDSLVKPRLQRWHRGTILFSSMGVLALLVAGLGVLGIASQSVTERTRELGIRLSVGATSSRIVSMILMQTGRVVAVGAALGLVCSVWLGRSLESLVFGVTPHDPATLIIAALVLLSTACVAALVPALRAARVDPMVVLSED